MAAGSTAADPRDMEERTRYVIAAAVLVGATPVATWWVVGDLSSEGFDDLDYMVRPPAIPPLVETLAGVVAVAAVLASATVLGLALHRRRLRRVWRATVVPLCAAGVVVGCGARMVTAGGIGANIGGAMAVFFGLPLAFLLIVAAALNGWWERGRF